MRIAVFSFLLSLCATQAMATTLTGYVCAVSDGVLTFNARGPNPEAATAYAEKACRIYGKNPGQCNQNACQLYHPEKPPKPAIAIVAIYDLATSRQIPLSRVIPPAPKVSPAPLRIPRTNSAKPTGHCANNGPTYSKDCFWIKSEDSNSCVPTSSSSDWIICRPLTRFGPAVCSNEKRCTWSD